MFTIALASLTMLLAVAAPAAPQTTTGTILGTVSDESDAVLPGATVTITSRDTGISRTVVTAADGSFAVPALPPGSYQLTVSLDGFRPYERSGVTLEVGQNARVDARLELGSINETITVQGDALHVDTASSSVGVVIDKQRLESLPMNGRGVLSLALLVPGVGASTLPTTVVDQRTGPTIAAGGSRSNQNNIMLDGAQLATSLRNVAGNLPSPDSLQEFQVLTNTYSAEYGRASGATMMAITKSGSNSMSGGAWEYLRNDALNSTNFFALTKPALEQNQFGGRFGGPIKKNQAFFFASYEGIRIRQEALFQYNPPTAAQRAGDFSAVATPIRDPSTGLPFPGNVIPTSRLDPMALNILQAYVPLPNQGVQSNTVNPRPTDGDQLTVKVDHKFSSADTITGRFYRNKATGIVGGGNINDLASPRGNLVQGVTFSNTHLFASNLVSEARVSITKLETEGPVAAVNQTPQQLGALYAQDGSIALAPTTNVSGAFNMQPNQPWLERSQLVDFDVKMSWITGRQSFRFGFMGLHQSQRLQTAFQSSGVFTFDGTITGNPTADFMLGRPRSFVQQSVLDNLERSQTYGAFFQDDIKVGRRLTLNAGLRYDLFLPWEEEGGRSATLRPGQQSTRYSNAPPGLVYPGDAGVPNGLVPTDKNNWAPRVGFAWDVRGDGLTSIRGAYGLFYTPQGSITVANQNEAPPFVQVVSLASPGSLRDPYSGSVSPFPYTESASGAALFFYPTQVFSADPGFRTGFVHQYNANVQQQFGSQVIVQAGYFGARGRQLASSREINAAVYGPGATAANAQQRRPYLPQNFAGISQAFSDSRSDYDALQVSATQKYARGVTVQLAYTLSKSMDNRSTGSTDAASVQNPNDPFDGEWAPSDFDQRHILRVNGLWDLPRLENRAVLRHVLGGWRLAGIVSKTSGQPFTVVSGRDVALVGPSRGLAAQRPDLVSNPELTSDRSRDERIAQWFNTAAYAFPAAGQFGNGGRNRLRAPGFFSTDASISKRFEPWSTASARSFELRIEVFNLFNTVNLLTPVNNLSSATFGRIVSAGDARVFQLALRFNF